MIINSFVQINQQQSIGETHPFIFLTVHILVYVRVYDFI